MEMKIYFPGGKKVYTDYNGFTHKIDQPIMAGGKGTASAPFDLFLASLGSCAGLYVLGFCQQRELETEGLFITQKMEISQETRLIETVNLTIHLPEGFPEKYKKAIVNTARLCTVKRHLDSPPTFNVITA